MWPWVSKYLLYLPLQAVRGEHVLRHIHDLGRSQWESPETLRARQGERLRALVAHAASTIPHYRESFARHSVSPEAIRSVDDLTRLPVLTKHEARAAGRRLVSEACRVSLDSRNTSGSTGLPMSVLKSRDAIARIRALWYRYLRWYGIDMGSRQGRFLGHPVSWKRRLKEDVQDFVLNKDRLDPVYLTPDRMGSYWRRIRRRPPDHLYGYPSAMAAFTRFVEQEGGDPSGLGLKALVCTGETLYPFQRENLQRAWNAPAVNEYGCTESGVLAFPCPEQGRLHVSADHLVLEVLAGDRPARPGEAGEVVLTELYSHDAPLIRYRLGDIVVPSERPSCSCRRGLPVIERVEGRTSQLIRLPNGREAHSEVFSYISDCFGEVDSAIDGFRVRLRGHDAFTLQLVAGHAISPETRDALAALVRRVLGEGVAVEVEQVDFLPRDPSGKLGYFVREEDPPPGGPGEGEGAAVHQVGAAEEGGSGNDPGRA